ncbi:MULTISPECIES: pyridoxal phosphate-dependent aminotransferase [Komagataeibacter]|uniref:Aminotransferase n=2 Tax=Komagataeibacter TaxID=1434011 RepID=A0ABS5SKU2_9PROT|nr:MULTISPECIES: pyridoxal phosphate-dependent aminotransferase [Komagataeibacter]MBL7233840.1 pyridoxal phosphate-dependent aminotransferase [Komagataeibacter oboediens]MBT0674809.1 pyridoxal phosphate-dependent aminotransferase [Komagataeibacter oboediens]MBT0678643.1 pyridoxal phosphate-dependent aminotransferase [Komagataeibacter oboediens]
MNMDAAQTHPLFAQRMERLTVPATIAMAQRARNLRAKGEKVLSLALGEPDFPTPAAVIEAAHRAALDGQTKYPPVDGTPALKAAIARKFARENALDYAPAEIMVSNGGKQVIFNAFMATVQPGDEVVIPRPYWVSYPLIVQMFGGTPVYADCHEADGFRLTAQALEAAITPRTKWLVLNFPNNPTGGTMGQADLEAVAEVLRRHPHVHVLSDEIYEHLLYDGLQHHSLAAVAPDLKGRILTLNGVSKAYAMTGWRVGYVGGPTPLIRAMTAIQGSATSGICSISQAAAAAALDGPADIIAQMCAVYARRREMVVSTLRAIPGLTCAMPHGAFYAYPGIAGCMGRVSAGGQRLETDQDFAIALLMEQHVAVVHGSAFGQGPYLRLSYATSDDILKESCARIARFVDGLT